MRCLQCPWPCNPASTVTKNESVISCFMTITLCTFVLLFLRCEALGCVKFVIPEEFIFFLHSIREGLLFFESGYTLKQGCVFVCVYICVYVYVLHVGRKLYMYNRAPALAGDGDVALGTLSIFPLCEAVLVDSIGVVDIQLFTCGSGKQNTSFTRRVTVIFPGLNSWMNLSDVGGPS